MWIVLLKLKKLFSLFFMLPKSHVECATENKMKLSLQKLGD